MNDAVEHWDGPVRTEPLATASSGTVAAFAPTAASADVARLASVGAALFASRSAEGRARVAAEEIARHLGRPAAVGLPWGGEPALAGDPEAHETLAAALDAIRATSGDRRIGTRIRYGALVAVHAGAAEIVVLDPPRGVGRFLEAVATVLAEAVDGAAVEMDMSLAWTAHEIRSPLAAVRTVLDQMLRDDGAVDRDLVERARDELTRSGALVDSILRWTDPSAERLSVRPAVLADVVADALEDAGLEIASDRLVVETADDAVVLVDPLQLSVVLRNLVRNALAYSDRAVVVSVSSIADVATVTVTDQGSGGVDVEADAFAPFVRGTGASARAHGSGLGLFISRRIVEAHGGRLTFERHDDGAAFRVELPVHGSQRGSRCAS